MGDFSDLLAAIRAIPPGQYAVGVSGGADSMALLHLVAGHSPMDFAVVHVNHQLRGNESEADEAFVSRTAEKLKLPIDVYRREQLEGLVSESVSNPSARYRAMRLAAILQSIEQRRLDGVLYAHHADDQAETIALRLQRGSGYAGLCGIAERTLVDGVLIVRPLLSIRSRRLREYLSAAQLTWREDSSNADEKYARNSVRKLLATEKLHDALIALGQGCERLREWVDRRAPILKPQFAASELIGLPRLFAERAVQQWLLGAGVPGEEISPAAIQRLLAMAADAATSPRQDYPGRVRVIRRAGKISASREHKT